MQIILSPSKTQSFSASNNLKSKLPVFLEKANDLAKILKGYSADDLATLMKMSSKLAVQTFTNYQAWDANGLANGRQAIFAYQGAVYSGFDLENYSPEDFSFLDSHINILSGLYGVLSPLDLIQAYRLDVGQKLGFELDGIKYTNLYKYWSSDLNQYFLDRLEPNEALLNLASLEYSKMLDKKLFNFVDLDFKVLKDNKLKTIGIYAKQQRGRMANWIVKRKINDIKSLENYTDDGFGFDGVGSSPEKLLFVKIL